MMKAIWIMLLVLGVASCGSSQDSQFYLLNPTPKHAVRTVTVEANTNIGIGPVIFPKYLNQPQIVIRETQSQLKQNEFHRWAEPLDDNVTRVIQSNLANILKTSRVVIYPWRHADGVDYQILIDISRFDSDECGNVILEARWQVLDVQDKKIITTRARTYHDRICKEYNYDDLARSMSRLLGHFSRDIALSIVN